MKRDLETKVAGWFFLVAAALFWGGWFLLRERPGVYFDPGIFPAIHEHLAYWISIYRIHIFGMVMTVLSLAALAVCVTQSPSRILIWPGVAVAAGGLFFGSAPAAFSSPFCAWGGLTLGERPIEERQALVDSLLLLTEYVSCLVRFGRVFSGFGLLVIAAGLLVWRVFPKWLGVMAAAMGAVAIAVTMAFPETPALYAPVFHAWPLWMALAGWTILRGGIRTG